MDTYTSPDYDRAALITIDVQRDTLDGQPFEIPGTSLAVPQIARAVDFFRARAQPIVHVVRLYKADGTNVDSCRRLLIEGGSRLVIAGSAGAELAPPLLPSAEIALDADRLLAGELQTIGPAEWIMYKPRWGAFFGTPLEEHLRSIQVSTLVFGGCNFPNCPRTSIYEASERDFRIVVVADALSGLYPVGRKELENIGVRVVDTEEYFSAARSSGNDPRNPA
jgi:nicotinamidase-related amidase